MADHAMPISVRHRIVGEYLADPDWTITKYMVSDRSIDLDAPDNDTTSSRHAYDLAVVMDRFLDVINIPVHDGRHQLVTVTFQRPDNLFVYVHATYTDPVVIARLRGVAADRARDQRVIVALSGPDEAVSG